MDFPPVGTVVIVSFPYADFSALKSRPALVVAWAEFDNLILCQITSKPYASHSAIRVDHSHFFTGGLPVESYVRPDKLFTTEPAIIQKVAGTLKTEARDTILTTIRSLFKPKI